MRLQDFKQPFVSAAAAAARGQEAAAMGGSSGAITTAAAEAVVPPPTGPSPTLPVALLFSGQVSDPWAGEWVRVGGSFKFSSN